MTTNQPLPRTTRYFAITKVDDPHSRASIVPVECAKQRGVFYAYINALHATRIVTGKTEEEAFANWALQCRGRPVETAHKD